MKTKILCTLGPSSLRPEIIRQLDERGVDVFRINLSHTPLEAVEPAIEFVRSLSSTPICLDTEGAQVRCGAMAPDIVLNEGQSLRLTAAPVTGTAAEMTLWPASVFDDLRIGSLVHIDFDGAILHVDRVGPSDATATVMAGGRVGSNKAVTVTPAPRLPPLTEKDRKAITIGLRCGIRHFALSFASSAEDVAVFRSLVPSGTYLISKIESREGVRNVDSIIATSDAILIDRGDLSREIPIEYVPVHQKHIIRRANTWNKPVLVATNLLESMVRNSRPTVAEANDIVNTLLDGAHGLVLAAETAIGAHPIRSVEMIQRILDAFEHSTALAIADERADVATNVA